LLCELFSEKNCPVASKRGINLGFIIFPPKGTRNRVYELRKRWTACRISFSGGAA